VIDENVAHELQRRHIAGEHGAFSGLYAECRRITETLAKAYASRHECDISNLEDTIQIILSRVLSRYRNPGYKIFSFSKVLNIEVVHELSNHKGPKAAFAKSIVPIESIPEPASKSKETQTVRPGEYFTEILRDPGGVRIVFTLRRSTTYRSAILSIESIAGRRWIYDNAERLFYLWKHMRHGKKEHHGVSGPGDMGGNKAADRGDKFFPAKGKQAHDEQGV
jgi:hypothetical protein